MPERAFWISSAAVRQALGAWAYTRGAGEERPSSAQVRVAIAIAAVIVEHAVTPRWPRGGEASPSTATWRAAVPEDLADFASRAGVSLRETEIALELLAAAGVIERRGGVDAVVQLAEHAMIAAPAAAQVDWDGVRARLSEVGGSQLAAMAVLRELACATGAIADPVDAPSVRASVRELEDTTAFGRSTVADAVAALERAGLLAVETRAGRTTRFSLPPAAFGLEPAAPVAPATPSAQGGIPTVRPAPDRPATRARLGPASDPAPPGRGAGRGTVQPAPRDVAPSAGAPVLIGEFAGTPIHAPPGTPLIVECDERGQWTCRVGPFLRLGPAVDAP